MTFFHINIRSSNKNFDDFHDLIYSFPKTLDVVCVSETRIKGNSLVNISIPGYNFFHVDSLTNAGGVGVYVSKHLNCDINANVSLNLPQCEDIWINVDLNDGKNIVIGTIYRHPNSNSDQFRQKLGDVMSDIADKSKTFYILGDMNIDISTDNRTTAAETYINELLGNGDIPVISYLTRVTSSTSTIINYIITNDSTH